MKHIRSAAILPVVALLACSLVNDSTAPDLDLVYPAPWAALTLGPTTLKAEAHDATGVEQVVFFADGDTVGTRTEAPYEVDWTSTTTGNHTLYLHATDAAGNLARTEPVVVTVYEDTDTLAPDVILTAPAEWQAIAGPVTLKAEAEDDDAVSRVVFVLDGDSLTSATSAPYRAQWSPTEAERGNHSLFCRAYDLTGNMGVSRLIYVTVADTSDSEPPTVEMVRPAAWSTVNDTTIIEAVAWDRTGLARVVFYLDGDSLRTVSSNPYRFDWNSREVDNGSHTLYARAWDLAGNHDLSPVVTFYVDNAW